MTALKTKPNDQSVDEFLKKVENPNKREECYEILNLMREITQEEPRMWGDSIVGFGSYHYRYASGLEGDWFLTGFSPRKQNLTIYIMPGLERFEKHLKNLGKFKTGKSCLYINKLSNINIPTLRTLINESIMNLKEEYK